MTVLPSPKFNKLVRPKPPVFVIVAVYPHHEEIIGLTDDEEAAAQLIENHRKLPEYEGAKFYYHARVVWSKQKDE